MVHWKKERVTSPPAMGVGELLWDPTWTNNVGGVGTNEHALPESRRLVEPCSHWAQRKEEWTDNCAVVSLRSHSFE